MRGTTDERGKSKSTQSFDAWGAPQDKNDGGGAKLASLFGFTGERQDTGNGLVYLRARWYAPELGRFLSRDSYRLTRSNPRTIAPYLYAADNPASLVDPTGFSAASLFERPVSYSYAAIGFYADPAAGVVEPSAGEGALQANWGVRALWYGPDTGRLTLRATSGEDGGACVYVECQPRVNYSQETTFAAAETRMMWYLETQATAPRPSDYTRLSLGLGVVAADFWIDRYDRFYLGAGPSLAIPGLSLMQGFIEGDDPSAHSQDAVDTFISGWTRNETLGFVLAYGHTGGVGDRHANEVGITTPGASLSATYAWRGQDASQATVDWFLGR